MLDILISFEWFHIGDFACFCISTSRWNELELEQALIKGQQAYSYSFGVQTWTSISTLGHGLSATTYPCRDS